MAGTIIFPGEPEVGPLRQISAGAAVKLGGSALFSTINPVSRQAYYLANSLATNFKPGIDEALHAFYANRISPAQLTDILSYQGINWAAGAVGGTSSTQTWRALVDLAKPQLPLDLYRDLYRRDRIGPDILREKMERSGLSSEEDWRLYAEFTQTPELMLLMRMLLSGTIGDAAFKVRVKQLGYSAADVDRVLDAMWEPIPPASCLEMMNRRIISEDKVREQLTKSGIRRIEEQDAIIKTANIIPPYSDIQRLAVKEAWKNDIVAEYGYDEEIPPEYIYWAKRTGLHWGEPLLRGDPAWGDAGLVGIDDKPAVPWWKLLWRAKWNPLSPTQAFEALHRWRGNPADPRTWRLNPATGLPQKPFTMNNVNDMLKIADYPPALRPILAGLSYSVLRLVDIRKMYRTGLRDAQWAVGKFQDRGVERNDAILQVDLIDKEVEDAKQKEIDKRTRRAEIQFLNSVIDAYREGWQTDADVIAAYDQIGWTRREAGLAINTVIHDIATDTARQAVNRAKSDYLSYRASELELRARLANAGITPWMVDNLFIRWNNMRTESRAALTAAKVLNWTKRGLLTIDQARFRLGEMGYGAIDTELLVNEAAQDITELNVKAFEAQQKRQLAAAKELIRVQKEAAALQERIKGKLRTLTPVAVLKKWVKLGSITPIDFEDRMLAMGYPIEVVQLHLDEIARTSTAATPGAGNGS